MKKVAIKFSAYSESVSILINEKTDVSGSTSTSGVTTRIQMIYMKKTSWTSPQKSTLSPQLRTLTSLQNDKLLRDMGGNVF